MKNYLGNEDKKKKKKGNTIIPYETNEKQLKKRKKIKSDKISDCSVNSKEKSIEKKKKKKNYE